MEELLQLKYLMFENEANVCWLDASIALVAHNETFKKVVKCSPESQINKIISSYNEAVTTYNNSDSEEKKMKAQGMLKSIQNITLNYLKHFLKFKHGEPDSAFCALLNLIYEDKSNIKEHLNISWIWRKQCSSCGVRSKASTCLKPIITLSKVKTFHPECPSSIYTCACKSEQEMKLIYKELPPCVIFHFEKVVSIGKNLPVAFTIKGREYQLTGVIVLEKNSDPDLNHFVTWIRNPVYNVWLECNDLNIGFASFSQVQPEFDLKDVYISIFEAFDNSGRINNDDVSTDLEHNVENSNVELINLSDEDDNAGKPDSCCKTKASEISKSITNDEASKFSKNSNSELNVSKELLLVDDELGNNLMSDIAFEDISYVRENEVNSNDEIQEKMQQTSLKDNKNNSNNSGKTRKEGIDNKYVIGNEEEGINSEKIEQNDKANEKYSRKIEGGGILHNGIVLSDNQKNFMDWFGKLLEMRMVKD